MKVSYQFITNSNRGRASAALSVELQLRWDANAAADDVSYYSINYGNSSGTYNGAGSPINAGNGLAYTFPLAGKSTPIYMALTATNDFGTSGYSNEIHFP